MKKAPRLFRAAAPSTTVREWLALVTAMGAILRRLPAGIPQMLWRSCVGPKILWLPLMASSIRRNPRPELKGYATRRSPG